MLDVPQWVSSAASQHRQQAAVETDLHPLPSQLTRRSMKTSHWALCQMPPTPCGQWAASRLDCRMSCWSSIIFDKEETQDTLAGHTFSHSIREHLLIRHNTIGYTCKEHPLTVLPKFSGTWTHVSSCSLKFHRPSGRAQIKTIYWIRGGK